MPGTPRLLEVEWKFFSFKVDRNSIARLVHVTPKGSSSRRQQKRRRGDRHTSLRARSPTSMRRTRPSDQEKSWPRLVHPIPGQQEAGNVTSFARNNLSFSIH